MVCVRSPSILCQDLTFQTTANLYMSSGGDLHIDSASDVHVQAVDGVVVQTIAPQGIHISSSGGDVTFEAGYTVMTGHLDVVNEIMATDFSSLSDRRLKTNIRQIGPNTALDMVLKMRGVTYRWGPLAQSRGGGRQIGMIAQEVEAIAPEVVADTGDFKAVSYSRLVPLLVEALKAQQEQVQDQGRAVEDLKSDFELEAAHDEDLRALARSLSSRIAELRRQRPNAES